MQNPTQAQLDAMLTPTGKPTPTERARNNYQDRRAQHKTTTY